MTDVSRFLTMVSLIVTGTVLGVPAALAGPPVQPADVEAVILDGFPSIEAAAAAVTAAEARLRQVRRLPDPTVVLGGGRGEDRFGPASGSQWSIGLELDLPAPWRYGRATGAATSMISVARADLTTVRARTVAQIRSLLLRLSAAQQRVEVLESQVELVRNLSRFTALRVKLGEGRELERLRMEVELGRVRRLAELAGAERDALVDALVRLSNGRLPARFTLQPMWEGTPPDVDGRTLADALLATNPELAAELERARAAEAQTALERSMALPTFVTRVERATDYDSRSTSLALALKVPLWNRNRPAVAAAAAEHRMAVARVEERRRMLLARLDRAVARYEAARRTVLRFIDTILPAARQATRLAELSYREGETSMLDLLDARRSAQESELEYLKAQLDLHLSKLEIDLLTGRVQSAVSLSTHTSRTSKEDAS